jgi:hypothetical protein
MQPLSCVPYSSDFGFAADRQSHGNFVKQRNTASNDALVNGTGQLEER